MPPNTKRRKNLLSMVILMNDVQSVEGGSKDKLIVATAPLCGCFGCHMSLLDIDERILGKGVELFTDAVLRYLNTAP